MEKVRRDGKTAVLVSPGFGAGWSTWNREDAEVLCMDADIVRAVLDGNIEHAIEVAEMKCPDIYVGGAEGLTVAWVPTGSQFEINEYDGSESLHVIGERQYLTA